MRFVKVKIQCPRCTRIQGRNLFSALFWIRMGYWFKANFWAKHARRVFRIEHLCKRCSMRKVDVES
ncbi:MAG: hypothetical protein CMK59_04730 [Proteobacteria bacterium]|nr:hypothetical protein [Pseudomonadota bacterium]